MTLLTKGMGVVKKIMAKTAPERKDQVLDVIKKSVTGKAGQKDIDEYHRIMTSDRQYKTDYGKK